MQTGKHAASVRSLVPRILTVLVLTAAGCNGHPGNPEAGEWELVEDLRIGSLDSSGPDQFGYVADIHVDAWGRFWIVDGPTQQIRIFDQAGRWVRTVGREGAGPGEFGTPGGLEEGPAGNVWVADGRNGRWTVLDSAGTFLTTHRYAAGMFRYGDRWGPDDLLYTWVVRSGGFTPVFDLVRRELRDGRLIPIDTLPVPEADPGKTVPLQFTRDGRRMTMTVPIPFQAVRKRALIPGSGWWLSHPGPEYRVARVDFTGDTVEVVERPYIPVRVSEADVATEVRRIGGEGSQLNGEIPGSHPPVAELIDLPDGGVVVLRRTRSGEVVDFVSPGGRLQATAQLPAGLDMDIRVASRDALVGVAADDLGVPYVVRLGLRRR